MSTSIFKHFLLCGLVLWLSACGNSGSSLPIGDISTEDGSQELQYSETALLEIDTGALDSATLSFEWEVLLGEEVLPTLDYLAPVEGLSLSESTQAQFTVLEVSEDQLYQVRVTVRDAFGRRATKLLDIMVLADISPKILLSGLPSGGYQQGEEITVQGIAGREGIVISSYLWALQAPEGSLSALAETAGVNSRFTPDLPGNYLLSLAVVYEDSREGEAEELVFVRNRAPTVSLSPDSVSQLYASDHFELTADADDEDGDEMRYQWQVLSGFSDVSTEVLAADPADLTTSATVTFTAPDVAVEKEYVLSVVVSDVHGGISEAASLKIAVAPGGFPHARISVVEPEDGVYLRGTAIALNGGDSQPGAGNAAINGYSWTLSGPAGSSSALDDAAVVAPTFTPDLPGDYVLALVVSDTKGKQDTAQQTVVVINRLPTASLSPNTAQNLYQRAALSLAATALDADGDTDFSYQWLVLSGSTDVSTAVLGSAPADLTAAATVSFTAPDVTVAGDYVLSVVVSDAHGGSSSAASVTITVTPTGDPQAVISVAAEPSGGYLRGTAIVLDGSGSTAGTGGPAISTYSWTLTAPTGSISSLDDASLAAPAFTPDLPGNYVLGLTVTDAFGKQDSSQQTVAVINRAPTASLSPNTAQNLYQRAALSLTASALDADGDTDFSYQWLVLSGSDDVSTAVLGSAPADLTAAATVSFTAPDVTVAGDYVLSVVVGDAHGGSSSAASVTITVSPTGDPQAVISVAAEPSGGYLRGTAIALDGSGSSAGEGDTALNNYSWTFVGPTGSTATWDDASLVAPAFTPDLPGDYVLGLTVTDAFGKQGSSQQPVAVINRLPTVSLSPSTAQNLYQRAALSLAATALDADGDSDFSYQWSVLSGITDVSTAVLGAAPADLTAAATVSFTAPDVTVAGDYVLSVVVSDAHGGSSSAASVTITVTPTGDPQAVISVAAEPSGGYLRGTAIALDGSGSSAGAGDTVIEGYSWTLTAPMGSTSSLDDVSLAAPAFTPDLPGDYVLGLTVTDAFGKQDSSQQTVAVINRAPTASLSPSMAQSLYQRAALSLTASALDADGDSNFSYQWLVLSGSDDVSTAVLGSAPADLTAAATVSFTAPDVTVAGDYVLSVVVGDAHGGSSSAASITITVTPTGDPQAVISVAAEPSGGYLRGTAIALDGSGSSAGAGDTVIEGYSWTLTAPTGSISSLDDASLAAPAFTPDLPGNYVLGLTVTDAFGKQGSSQQTVAVVNQNPTASLSPNTAQNLYQRAELSLTASALDADGDTNFSYQWLVLSGSDDVSTAVLGSAPADLTAAATVSFTAPDVTVAGDYVLSVVVGDAHGGSSTAASVTITVTPTGDPQAVISVAAEPSGGYLRGTAIALDGSGSSAGAGDTVISGGYSWTLTAPTGSISSLDDASLAAPRFTPDLPGDYVLRLTVTDAFGKQGSSQQTVAVVNQNPTVSLSPSTAQNLYQRAALSLAATALDADGDSDFSYQWSVLSGITDVSTAVLGAAPADLTAAATVSFTAPDVTVAGDYVLSVVVSDAHGGSSSAASVTITVTPTGDPQAVLSVAAEPSGDYLRGTAIALDGSGSTAGTGGPAISTYSWTLTAPTGSISSLDDASLAAPAFTPDLPGNYVLGLTVTDAFGKQDSSQQTVAVINRAPTASLSPNTAQNLYQRAALSLTASALDADGDTDFSYQWLVLSGSTDVSTAVLGSAPADLTAAATVSFTAPDVTVAGDYVLSVVVGDAHGGSSSAASVTITVSPTGDPQAVISVAAEPSGGYLRGTAIALDGSGSSAGEGDTALNNYSWTFVGPTGSTATWDDASLVAPAFTPDLPGDYVLGLTVTDAFGKQDSSQQTVAVINRAPTASLSPSMAQSLYQRAALSLTASALDADGDSNFSYQWLVLSGSDDVSTAVLGSAPADLTAAATVSFTAPDVTVAGDYVLSVVVGDAHGGSSSAASITITVTPTGDPQAVISVAAEPSGGYLRGTAIALDGSGSSAGAGDTVIEGYSWTLTAPTGSISSLDDASLAAPAFTPDLPGNYVLGLTVTDAFGKQGSSQQTVAVVNQNPTASLSPNTAQNLYQRAELSLTASALDADGDTNFSYQWLVLSGSDDVSTAVLGSAPADLTAAATVSFTAPDVTVAGDYVLSVVVGDAHGGSSTAASVTITVTPTGDPQAVISVAAEPSGGYLRGTAIALDGSGSSAGAGDTVISGGYSWTLTAPTGSISSLDDASLAAPRFTPDLPGNYVLGLTVTDAFGKQGSSQQTVAVVNQNPTASLSPNTAQNLYQRAALSLAATALDADGDSDFSYQWSVLSGITDVSTAVLGAAPADLTAAATVSFTAPDVTVAGDYVLSVVVSDAHGGSSSAASVTITVTPTGDPQAVISVAAEPSGGYLRGTAIVLDGSGSTAGTGGPAISTYSWTLTAPTGSISSLDDASLAAPAFTPDLPGNYVLGLTVTDAFGKQDSSQQTVAVINRAPTASLSPNTAQNLYQRAALSLTASALDADGDTDFSYQWLVLSGSDDVSTAVLGSAPADLTAAATVSFTAPDVTVAGDYVLSVVVGDAHGGSSSAASVTITVSPTGDPQAVISVAAEPSGGYLRGTAIALDGSGSSAGEGDTALNNYSWTFVGPTGSTATWDDASLVAPAFTPDLPGDYVLGLTVTDAFGKQGSSQQPVAVINRLPTVSLSPSMAQSLYQRAALSLAATALDADGDSDFSYQWSVLSGITDVSTAVLGSAPADLTAAATVSFTAPDVTVAGDYVLSVVVSDAHGGSSSAASVTITVTPTGDPQAVISVAAEPSGGYLRGTAIVLDGSGSTAGTGGPAISTYSWTLTAPTGSISSLDDASLAAPAFTPDLPGNYVLGLTVTDAFGKQDSSQQTVAVINRAPTASLSPNTAQNLYQRAALSLTASGLDADGDSNFSYQWLVLSGSDDVSTAVLGSAPADLTAAATVSFTAPDVTVAGDYVLSVVVGDVHGGSSTAASITITVTPTGDPQAVISVAAEPSGGYLRGTAIALDGSGSTVGTGGPAISTYSWTLTAPTGSISSLDDASLAAPAFTPDLPGDYVLRLTVTDAFGKQGSSQQTVAVVNQNPTASLSPNTAQNLYQRAALSLTASGLDADGDSNFSYQWLVLFGSTDVSTAVLGSAPADLTAAATVSFTAPDVTVAGDYVLSVVVGDAHGGSSTAASVTITVTPTGDPQAVISVAAEPSGGYLRGTAIALDGSGSTAGTGGPAISTYSWTLTAPTGSISSLDDASLAAPAFTADLPGNYVLGLTVTDAFGKQGSSQQTVAVVNQNPTASLSPNTAQNLYQRAALSLAATALDADGDSDFSYQWSVLSGITDVSTAVLGAAPADLTAAATVSFTAPDVTVAGDYVLSVVVGDAHGGSSSAASVTITVTPTAPPVASFTATDEPSGGYPRAAVIALDSSGSTAGGDGPTITAYSWTLISPSGSTSTFGDAAAVATSLTLDIPGEYRVTMTVTDAFDKQGSTEKVFTVSNVAPVVSLSPAVEQTVFPTATLAVNAIASDVDGDGFTYHWQVLLGNDDVSVSALGDEPTNLTTSDSVTFTGPVIENPADYILRITVRDDYGAEGLAEIMISVPQVQAAIEVFQSAKGRMKFLRGSWINLDASASVPVDNESLSYAWTLSNEPAGSTAYVSGDTNVSPRFKGYVDGDYTVQLEVSGIYGSNTTSYTVRVGPAAQKHMRLSKLIQVGGEDGVLQVSSQQYFLARVDDYSGAYTWGGSCGTMEGSGTEGNFFRLAVAVASPRKCNITLTVDDGNGGTLFTSRWFSVEDNPPSSLSLAYSDAAAAIVREFSLPATGSYQIPPYFYPDVGVAAEMALNLRIEADGVTTCSGCGSLINAATSYYQVPFAAADTSLTINGTLTLTMQGTGGNSIAVTSRQDLEKISGDGNSNSLSMDFYQLGDIDLGVSLHVPSATPTALLWQPIGLVGAVVTPFSGSYDGQDFSIENIQIEQPDLQAKVGFFAYIEDGLAKNMRIVGRLHGDCVVAPCPHFGLLAGELHSSSSADVANNVAVVGELVSAASDVYGIGGFAGKITGDVRDSSFTGIVYVPLASNVGGFAGELTGSENLVHSSTVNASVHANNYAAVGFGWIKNAAQVDYFVANGHIDAGGSKIGGIAGRLESTAWIKHSDGLAFVSAEGNEVGKVVGNMNNSVMERIWSDNGIIYTIGNDMVGGVVGLAGNYSRLQYISVNYMKIYGNNQVGGVAGKLTNNAQIREATARASVEGNEKVGGLVGEVNVAADVYDSYTWGGVTGQKYSGGLIGYMDNSGSGTTEMEYVYAASGMSNSADNYRGSAIGHTVNSPSLTKINVVGNKTGDVLTSSGTTTIVYSNQWTYWNDFNQTTWNVVAGANENYQLLSRVGGQRNYDAPSDWR